MTQPKPWPAPPEFYNSAAALDSIGSVAAPLLAGFSITLLGFALSSPAEIRWPGIVLALAMAAIVLLLTAVQLTAWAKRYVSSPDDARNWFEDVDAPSRREILVAELSDDAADYKRFASWARFTYDAGITLLFLTLGVAVVPVSTSSQKYARWVAAALAIGAAVTEATFSIATNNRVRKWLWSKLPWK